MRAVRVTMFVDERDLEKIRELVAGGRVASVAGFVRRAVERALDELDDGEEWQGMLADALERTGGPLTKGEREWADRVLAGSRGAREGAGRPERGA